MVTGVGSQFLAIATGVLVMALMGMFNVHRHGSINIAVIVLYALTSCMLRSPFSVAMFVHLPFYKYSETSAFCI